MQTLTEDKKSIWHGDQEVKANLSLSTLRRIAKKSFSQYKPAFSVNDYCIYCYDLKEKVQPQVQELLTAVRRELEEEMPFYFAAWDEMVEREHLTDRPGLHLRQLRHFIFHHSEQGPCRHHAQQQRRGQPAPSFPCGLAHLRTRENGFPQRRRFDLRAKEAGACVRLQNMSKLLDGYVFHRAANDFQKPLMAKLLDEPVSGTLTILSDFKEQVTLPIRGVQTGEEFYANSRKEISIFGSVLSERDSGGKVPLDQCNYSSGM